ncbi:MAG: alanine racemase, partial [Synergistales bacterium]|nr:alanine racemase [Synergistales bacterium]
AGSPVGYGASYVAERPTQLATLPVRYADGYPRLLSNVGKVLIGGSSVPILGKVCMDQMMVDVTVLAGVGVGDEVVLLGSQGGAGIDENDMAEWFGSVNDAITSSIGARVPRRYL